MMASPLVLSSYAWLPPIKAVPTRARLVDVRMDGPGFKGGGLNEGVTGGKYSSAGMSTSSTPEETMRPKVVDMEAAAASQAGIKDMDPVESIQGGFGAQATCFVDNLRVGDGKLAGDVGFD